MKLHFLSENIQKKLSFLNRIVSQRSQLPILLNFLIEAKNGKLKVSATDLELGAQIEIPANIEEEGKTTVPAKLFSELIASIPQEKITLQKEKETLRLITKNIKSSFQTAPPEEFPKLYESKGERILRITTEELRKIFLPVIFAASLDAGRPALSGVLIKKIKNPKKPGEIKVVATDGYRLSLKTGSVGEGERDGEEESKEALVPARAIREALGINHEEEDVKIYISKESNQVLFFQTTTILVGRLIEAEFPAYEKIIPADFSTRVLFDREQMQKAVKICSIFARDAANIIRLSFQKEKVIVSANAPSVGENVVEVEAKLEGEENEIAFNARYLLDILGNLEEESLVFEMSGPLSPGVFKIEGDASFLHLIMPIRVQTE
ncbi:MAG: DNA polymerase III subunit beta [bacterium]|nr:DNA polymerase III subunit beta [bacterium]